MKDVKHPPVSLRSFPPLSHRCAMRAGGRPQRGGAALAREPLAWSSLVLCVVHKAQCDKQKK